MVIRLLVLLVLVGVITLFVVQNAAPTLALAFLGFQTPPFPLSWWVVGALVAGASTTVVIQVLLSLSSLVTQPSPRSRERSDFVGQRQPDVPGRGSSATQPATPRDRADDTVWQDWRGYESANSGRTTPTAAGQTAPDPAARQSAPNDLDDWERPINDDWDADPPQAAPRTSRDRLTADDLRDFEVKQAPRQSSTSGSVYSYSYREPEPVDAPKTEPVVDAEYRVLVPPYQPLDMPPPPPVENADDWFEDADAPGDTPRRQPD